MTAVVVRAVGGPEVLQVEERAVEPPGPGEVRIRHTAIGVNYLDTYHRSGLYPVALPLIPGTEAAGVVEALGAGVEGLIPGDRVAYATALGAYCSERNVAAGVLVKVPDGVDDRTAAAALLKGMTARFLLRETFVVQPGHVVLVHAAAGGVGSLLCQWAAHLGATVVGTVGSAAKVELARRFGCHQVVVSSEEDVAARVRALVGPCDVVYDGVGAATITASLDSLKPRGLMVSFGNASGPVRAFDVLELSRRGSLYLTRPTLFTYVATREALAANAADLFAVLASGAVAVQPPRTWPLAQAADAHRALESRATTGSTVLLP